MQRARVHVREMWGYHTVGAQIRKRARGEGTLKLQGGGRHKVQGVNHEY